MEFFTVLDQIVILFLLLVVGYWARASGALDQQGIQGLTSFLVRFALPAMIIGSLQVPFSDQLLAQGKEVLLLSLIFYLIAFIVAWPLPRMLGVTGPGSGTYQFLLAFPNVAFMGYPVITAIFGKGALFYASLYMLPFNLLAFTVGILMLKRTGGGLSDLDPKILLNPGVTAVVVGLIFFLTSFTLPGPIGGAVTLLGDLTTPLSMVVIGGVLAEMAFKSVFSNWRVYVVSVMRLLLVPLLTWVILRSFITDPLMLGIPVILAAMPSAANAVLLAEEYKSDAELASQGVFISTLFCIITIPMIAELVA